MAYVDLGKYQFTTGADYTGLNSGNLTSVLQTSPIRIPYFELYRLLINTSQVPSAGSIPSLVQKSPMVLGSSLTALDLTMPAKTTKGNLIVVAIGSGATGDNPIPSAMTLGGSADNFGQVLLAGSATSTSPAAALWADPSCGEESTAIAVTLGSGSGTPGVTGQAYEIAGCLTTSSAAASVDVSTSGTVGSGSGVSSYSTPVKTTTAANDFEVGVAYSTASYSFSYTGIGPNVTVSDLADVSGVYFLGLADWQLDSVAGSQVVQSVSMNEGGIYLAAAIAAFLPTTTPPAAAPFPFTVAIDGVTWDQEETTAGVGYTYNIGQSPLYLNTGQTIEILWDLSAAQYANYSQQFNITGWFRYDPAVQP